MILTGASQPNPISRSGRRASASDRESWHAFSLSFLPLQPLGSNKLQIRPRELAFSSSCGASTLSFLRLRIPCLILSPATTASRKSSLMKQTNNGIGNNIKAFGSRCVNSHLVSPPTPTPAPAPGSPALLLILIWSLLLYLIASLAQCIAFCSRPVF